MKKLLSLFGLIGGVLGSEVDTASNPPVNPIESKQQAVDGTPQELAVDSSGGSFRTTGAISFKNTMQMLGLTDSDDTTKISQYLATNPSKLITFTDWGDIKKHFHESGVLQDLAVLHGEAQHRSKEPTGSASPSGDLTKVTIKAVGKFVKRLRQILTDIDSGGQSGGILSKFKAGPANPILTRNIEYLIVALWFLQTRHQFIDLSDTTPETSNNRINSLRTFTQMLDLILEPGFGDNVGIQYNDFPNCFASYFADADDSTEDSATRASSLFSPPRSPTGSSVIHFKAPKMELLAAFMVYEAIAEYKSMRVRRGTGPSEYQKYRGIIDSIRVPFRDNRCSPDFLKSIFEFGRTVFTDKPLDIFGLTRMNLLQDTLRNIPPKPTASTTPI